MWENAELDVQQSMWLLRRTWEHCLKPSDVAHAHSNQINLPFFGFIATHQKGCVWHEQGGTGNHVYLHTTLHKAHCNHI